MARRSVWHMPLPRTAVVLPAVAALLVGSAACAPMGERRLTFQHTESAPITEIAIVSAGSGDLTVRTRPGETVEIERTVRYQHDEPGATHRVVGTVLELEIDCGWRCNVSYDIDAPPGVSVRGENGSGRMTLTDVSSVSVKVGSGDITIEGADGDVTAQTGSGGVSVRRAAGPVTLTTGSGSIEGHQLGGGGVSATTGSGGVTLSLDSPGPVRAQTSSGSVQVTVPAGSYQVQTRTGSGNADVQLPHDADGEHLIDVETGSGGIRIVQR